MFKLQKKIEKQIIYYCKHLIKLEIFQLQTKKKERCTALINKNKICSINSLVIFGKYENNFAFEDRYTVERDGCLIFYVCVLIR